MKIRRFLLAFVLVDLVAFVAAWGLAARYPRVAAVVDVNQDAQYLYNLWKRDRLEKQIVDTSAFIPPADDLLTADQLDTALDIWAITDPALTKAHVENWRDEDAERVRRGIQPGERLPIEVGLPLSRRRLAINVQAMVPQVTVLNRHQMSLAEYRWLKWKALDANQQRVSDDFYSDLMAKQIAENPALDPVVRAALTTPKAPFATESNARLLREFGDRALKAAPTTAGF
jgi:hypothetical protein